jgi:hypothetical protein
MTMLGAYHKRHLSRKEMFKVRKGKLFSGLRTIPYAPMTEYQRRVLHCRDIVEKTAAARALALSPPP